MEVWYNRLSVCFYLSGQYQIKGWEVSKQQGKYCKSFVSQNWKYLLCLECLLLKIPVWILHQLQFSQYPPRLVGGIDYHAKNLLGGRYKISHNCVHSCWVWQECVENHAVDKRFPPYISLSEGLWWSLIEHWGNMELIHQSENTNPIHPGLEIQNCSLAGVPDAPELISSLFSNWMLLH